MILGLTFEKLIILGFIAVMIVGPTRLPLYAAKLAQAVKAGKRALNGARARMEEELGPEMGEIDWKKLDPRQYDPRRIIRSALLDDEGATGPGRTADRGPKSASTSPSTDPRAAREAASADRPPDA